MTTKERVAPEGNQFHPSLWPILDVWLNTDFAQHVPQSIAGQVGTALSMEIERINSLEKRLFAVPVMQDVRDLITDVFDTGVISPQLEAGVPTPDAAPMTGDLLAKARRAAIEGDFSDPLLSQGISAESRVFLAVAHYVSAMSIGEYPRTEALEQAFYTQSFISYADSRRSRVDTSTVDAARHMRVGTQILAGVIAPKYQKVTSS